MSLYTLIVNEHQHGESLESISEMIWCCWEYYASVSNPTLVNHLTIDQIIKCYLIDNTRETVDMVRRVILRQWDALFSTIEVDIINYTAFGDSLVVTLKPKEYCNASGY